MFEETNYLSYTKTTLTFVRDIVFSFIPLFVAITNIAGTGFQPGAVVLFATNSGMNQNTMSLTNVNVVSSTQIVGLLNIPSAQSINTYYIRVTNTDGNSGRSNAKIFNVV